jgi:hypothetical protein
MSGIAEVERELLQSERSSILGFTKTFDKRLQAAH